MESPKKLLELVNELRKVSKYKMIIQRSIAFLYTDNEQLEIGLLKIPFIIASKIINI